MGYNQPQKHWERKEGREENGQRILGSGNLELNKKDHRLNLEVKGVKEAEDSKEALRQKRSVYESEPGKFFKASEHGRETGRGRGLCVG